MSPQVAVRTPGKVNLQLSVGPLGEDGYHPIATIFQAVDLHEVVVAQPRTDGHITLTVEAAPGAAIALDDVPLDQSNLAWRAAELVAREYGIADGVDLAILKGVPVAGGMAGGSADAAAALIACAEAWEVGAPRAELVELASRLGADVPFACMGHTAVGLGRGERLSPAMTHGTFHWVFATQETGLSTPDIYRTFDAQVGAGERSAEPPVISDAVMTALMSGDPTALGAALTNDLQDAALELAPHLADTIDAAMDAEACGAIVSGSGPTVAALARSSQHALSIAARLRASGTAHAVVVASGPVAGATVLA